MSDDIQDDYKQCPPRPEVAYRKEEAVKEIAGNFSVLPLYGNSIYNYTFKKHYSLENNQHLKCKWAIYKNKSASKVFTPYKFPEQRDLHFYNGAIRFLPSLSDYKRPHHRNTLKVGPGVDHVGQMPIPQEVLMKRNYSSRNAKEKLKKNRRSQDLDNKIKQ